jgi:hypothetical protein
VGVGYAPTVSKLMDSFTLYGPRERALCDRTHILSHRQSWRWLIGVYLPSVERRLRANGGDGSEAAYALEHLLRELQAILVRDNYTAITRLVEDR